MADDIPLEIEGSDPIPGTHPIVIVGPNGSGKTRLGVQLANQENADRIADLRHLEVPDLHLTSSDVAKTQFLKRHSLMTEKYWRGTYELQALLQKLKAEHAEAAMRCYPSGKPEGEPLPTFLRLIQFWHKHFPMRSIDLMVAEPTAVSKLATSDQPYPWSRMSAGERVTLFLAAKILDTTASILIIDEPEVHLHGVLAKRLWDELERLRPDCRFVYITHNLSFALSRRDAQFIVMESGGTPQILPRDTRIPDEVFENILGAATFSVTATRIIFCEGEEGSKDEALYSAWFDGPDTVVIPVGGSEQVQKCVDVFNSTETIKGLSAIGIIDRDYWPEKYLKKFPDDVFVLKVHEVESLLCLPEVFAAVA